MSLRVRDTFIDFEGANPSTNADFIGRTIRDTSQITVNSVSNPLILNCIISTIPDITGSLSQIKNLTTPTFTGTGEAVNGLHLGESSPNVIEHQHNQVPLQINYDFGEQCLINHFKINTISLFPVVKEDGEYHTLYSFARKIEFSGSNDNLNYTPLTEFNNDVLGTFADVNQSRMAKTFPNNNQFRFYRFKISEYGPHPDILDNFNDVDNFDTGSFFITEIEFENKEPSNKINKNAIIFSQFAPPIITLSNGWNIVGYNLPSPPTDFYEIMKALLKVSNLESRLDIIKNVSGQFHSPINSNIYISMGTAPGHLNVGEGYMMKCKNLPGGTLQTFFPLELTELGAPPQLSLLDFDSITEYKSFANANITSSLSTGWNMVSYPRYTLVDADKTVKATYAAFVDKPPGSITYDANKDQYFFNNQEVDIFDFALRGNANNLEDLVSIVKNTRGQFVSPQNNFSQMAFQPGEGYMILMNQAVDICFAGDLVTTALPFIDVQ